jgi:hypothetical protein
MGEERIGAVEIAAQDPRGALQERSHHHRGVRCCELPCGLVGVGAHLLRPAAAQDVHGLHHAAG